MKEVSNEVLAKLGISRKTRFRYFTTEEGKVFSYTKRNGFRELHPFYDKWKLYNVITIGGKKLLLHRLILMNYVKQPPTMLDCNHKNGVKTDNRLENLERCTESYNILEAQRLGLKPTNKLYQFTLDGELVKVWNSIRSACNEYGCGLWNTVRFNRSGVMYTTYKGYRWSKENRFPESKIVLPILSNHESS